MMDWLPIESLPDDIPLRTHALFWGRLTVSGSWDEETKSRQTWLTEFKVLKWAYVGREHGRGGGGSSNLDNWFEPQTNACARVDRLEATHWMPLPEPPQ
jgi:hypothetical protein